MSKLNASTYTDVAANTVDNAVLDADKIAAWYLDLKNVVNANSPEGQYAADAGSTDTYAVTLDPAPTAYAAGMVVRFKANTANSGACTLNVNSLGAKTIKKNTSDDMETGDIAADQIIVVCYDGTNFQFIGAATGEIAKHKADTTPHATVLGVQKFGLAGATAISIASDTITITQSSHLIDTEGLAATDNLSTINGGEVGDVLVLRSTSASRVITIKHGVGNIFTWDGSDIVTVGSSSVIELTKLNSTQWFVKGIQGVKRSEVQAGTASVPVSAAVTGSVAVTFPNAFASAPKVVCTVNGSTVYLASAFSVTTTGFTLWVRNVDGASLTATIIVDWIATNV